MYFIAILLVLVLWNDYCLDGLTITSPASGNSTNLDYPDLKTEVKGLWTNTHLFLLFICPYRTLNLFLPAQNGKDRDKLWDKDVVEMFLGDDWKNIRHYREFEIAPTGDWVDLAIDLDNESDGQTWDSGWQTQARIDEKAKIWFAAAKIPLSSISTAQISPATRWRMNLYRIDGESPDSQRRFISRLRVTREWSRAV